MTDLFVLSLIFIGFIIYFPHIIALLPIDISSANPFLIQSLLLIYLWYQTVRRFRFQWKNHRYQILTLSFFIFVLLNLSGVFTSIYFLGSFQLWSVFLTGFILYLTVANYQLKVLHEPEMKLEFPQRKFRYILLWIIFIFALLQSIYGFYQYKIDFERTLNLLNANPYIIDRELYPSFEHALKSKRIFGTFGNPNLYALVISMIFPIGLGLLFHHKQYWLKILISIGLSGMIFAILLSASRGGLVSLAIGILLFLSLLGIKKIAEQKIWFGLIALISILLIFYIQSQQSIAGVEQNVINRFETGAATVTERFHYWNISWQMISNQPILGSGLNSFGIRYGQYKPPEIGETRFSHNTFLQIWSEGGIISLLAYLFFIGTIIYYPFRRLKKIKRADIQIQYSAFYGAVIAFLIDGFYSFGFYWVDIFYLFCILLAGLYAAINAEFIPEPSPADILWRRQPNTKFLLITPLLTIAIMGYWYYWVYSSFRGQLKFQEGRIELINGDFQSAIESFKSALQFISMDSEFHQHLGNTLLLTGNTDRGIEHLKQAIRLNPYTAYYHKDLGDAYYRQGKLDIALKHYKQAIAYYPNKTLYRQIVARLYEKLGKTELAQKEWEIVESIISRER